VWQRLNREKRKEAQTNGKTRKHENTALTGEGSRESQGKRREGNRGEKCDQKKDDIDMGRTKSSLSDMLGRKKKTSFQSPISLEDLAH